MIISRQKNSIIGNISVIIAAIVIFLVWYKVIEYVGIKASLEYHLILTHLAGVIFLMVTVFQYHKWIAPIGIGHIRQPLSVLLATAVTAIYIIEFIYNKFTHQPPETWFFDVLNIPKWPLICNLFTFFILAPVGEEILFRGILLNLFITNKTWTTWVGVVLTSLLFTAIHQQYHNTITFFEIMVFAVIYAIARIRSKGLLLPILLHSFTCVLGILFYYMR